MLVGRVTARRLAAWLAEPERCMVIGDPQSVDTLSQKLCTSRVKADVVARRPLDAAGSTADLLRAPGVLEQELRVLDVHRVIVAPMSTDGAETLDLVRTAKAQGVRVSVLPRLLEVVGSSVEFDQVDGMTMLGVRRFGLTRSSWLLKRTFDGVGAGLLLILLGLPMLMIAALIRLDSQGPALFRQTRVGRHGRRFEMLKFRSMVRDADARKSELRHLNEAASGLFKIADDPRVTRVGRFLRRTSLDELPQLINVMRGEMSLVGPRPLVVDEDVMVQGLDRSRLHLTPGMTGHWQVLGSARIPMDEMVGIDYLYVANWSLWTDVKILLRTVPYMLSRGSM
jgi:exopolysaccharide biosynthesis polyprenyl glycosylphosphotransferase